MSFVVTLTIQSYPMQKPYETTPVLSGVSLQQLINRLVDQSRPIALRQHTDIINEVNKDMLLLNRQEKLVFLMQELLTTVLMNSRNGEIHISADRYRDTYTLQIEERNNYNGYALASSIGSLESDALGIGGHLSIKGPQRKVATISFIFPASC